MASTHDPAEQIRELERAEAAPYVDTPRSPAWVAPLFGAWAAAYVGAFALWDSILLFIGAMLLLVAVVGAFLGWFARRYGAFPMPGRGTPPPEIRRAYRLYAGGVIVVVALLVLTWWSAGLAAAAATAFVLVTVGLHFYENRYRRAADAVQERLR